MRAQGTDHPSDVFWRALRSSCSYASAAPTIPASLRSFAGTVVGNVTWGRNLRHFLLSLPRAHVAPASSIGARRVAMPRNERNPTTSVTVVRMIDDAVAGS
jgi:hypothetical protein